MVLEMPVGACGQIHSTENLISGGKPVDLVVDHDKKL